MSSYLSKAIIFLILISFFVPLEVKGIEIENPLEYESFEELIEAIIDFLAFYLAPPIAVIMIIVAGFYFVTAIGEPEKINKAKKIILWTLIGLLIIFCASGLIELFKEVVGIE